MVDKERQRRNDRGEATGGNGTARVWVFLGGVGRLLHHHLPLLFPGSLYYVFPLPFRSPFHNFLLLLGLDPVRTRSRRVSSHRSAFRNRFIPVSAAHHLHIQIFFVGYERERDDAGVSPVLLIGE